MAAVLLACLAGVSFGGLGVALRLGLSRVPDAEVGAFASVAIGFLVALPIAAGVGALDVIHPAQLWPFLALGVLVPGISQVLYVRAVRDIGPTRTNVLIGIVPLLSAVAAIVLLGEPLRAGLAVGTVLIVAGAVSLAWERVRPADFVSAGIVWALATVVLYATRDNVSRWAADDGETPGAQAACALLAAAASTHFAYLLIARRGRSPLPAIAAATRPFLLSAVCMGVGYTALLAAFERGRVTVVSPLNSTYALWTVVLATVFLGRTEAVNRRLVLAALLIVGGGALIGATR
jgi:drug/metabolite transporter (DMT)-like permease